MDSQSISKFFNLDLDPNDLLNPLKLPRLQSNSYLNLNHSSFSISIHLIKTSISTNIFITSTYTRYLLTIALYPLFSLSTTLHLVSSPTSTRHTIKKKKKKGKKGNPMYLHQCECEHVSPALIMVFHDACQGELAFLSRGGLIHFTITPNP